MRSSHVVTLPTLTHVRASEGRRLVISKPLFHSHQDTRVLPNVYTNYLSIVFIFKNPVKTLIFWILDNLATLFV